MTTPEPLSVEELDRLEELAGKATPGPWFHQGDLIHGPDKGGIDVGPLRAETYEDEPWADAAYIAACDPDTLRRLIRAARAAEPPKDALDVRERWIKAIGDRYPVGDGATLDPAVDEALRFAVDAFDAALPAATEPPKDRETALRKALTSLVGDHDIHPAFMPDCDVCVALWPDRTEPPKDAPRRDPVADRYEASIAEMQSGFPVATEPDDRVERLQQALLVANHKPHDQLGEPIEGFPVCSVCGAIQTEPADGLRTLDEAWAALRTDQRFFAPGEADGAIAYHRPLIEAALRTEPAARDEP